MRHTGARAYARSAPVPKMPPGLVEIMEGLTRDVLKNNPSDLYQYCADHMEKLIKIRDAQLKKQPLTLEDKIKRAQEIVRARAEKRRLDLDKLTQTVKPENTINTINQEVISPESSKENKSQIVTPSQYLSKTDKVSNDEKDEIISTKLTIKEENIKDSVLKTSIVDVEVISDVIPETSPTISVANDHFVKLENENELFDTIQETHEESVQNKNSGTKINSDLHECPFEANVISHIIPETISTINEDFKKVVITENVNKHTDQVEVTGEKIINEKDAIEIDSNLNGSPLDADIISQIIPESTATISLQKGNDEQITVENESKHKILLQDTNEENGYKSNDVLLNTLSESLLEGDRISQIISESNSAVSLNNVIEKQVNCLDGNTLEKVNVETIDGTLNENTIDESSAHKNSEMHSLSDTGRDFNDIKINNSSTYDTNTLVQIKEKVFDGDNTTQDVEETDIKTVSQERTVSLVFESQKDLVENNSATMNVLVNNSDLEAKKIITDPVIPINIENDSEMDRKIFLETNFTHNDCDVDEPSLEIQEATIPTELNTDLFDKEVTNVHEQNVQLSLNNKPVSMEIIQNAETSSNKIVDEYVNFREDRLNNETTVNANETEITTTDASFINDISTSEDKIGEMNMNSHNIELDSNIVSTETELNLQHNGNNMDLETAAITIQKVFRSFLFRSRASTFDDIGNDDDTLDLAAFGANDDNSSEGENGPTPEDEYIVRNMNKERARISRMDTVLQTVNEEKSLSLSTDDSSLSSAATTIQAHVRGFLTRNKLNSYKNSSTGSLRNSADPSISLDADHENVKNKTVLNIHIIPEGSHFLTKDESIGVSIDLPLDVSPRSSNLHPLGYDLSERRKQLKREDAIQSVSPPSNSSAKSDDGESAVQGLSVIDTEALENSVKDNNVPDIKDANLNNNVVPLTKRTTVETVIGRTDYDALEDSVKDDEVSDIKNSDFNSSETTPTKSSTIETVVERTDYDALEDSVIEDEVSDIKNADLNSSDTTPTKSTTVETIMERTDYPNNLDSPEPTSDIEMRPKLSEENSDEMDVVTPFGKDQDDSSPPKLLHSGEFHDMVLPTKVVRSDSSVVREFKNVLAFFLLWNN